MTHNQIIHVWMIVFGITAMFSIFIGYSLMRDYSDECCFFLTVILAVIAITSLVIVITLGIVWS